MWSNQLCTFKISITERESGCVVCFNVHCWEIRGEKATSIHSLKVTTNSNSSCSWLGQRLVLRDQSGKEN